MTLSIGTAAGAREVTEIHVGTVLGLKAVVEAWIGTAGGNQKVYSAAPLTVWASPDVIGWNMITPGVFYISSGSAQATASGGKPPYSYSWQTNAGGATVDNPTSDITGFQSSDGLSATATCIVTDDDDNIAESNPVSLF